MAKNTKEMLVKISWQNDPSKIKIGKGKNALGLDQYFLTELRGFCRSFTDYAGMSIVKSTSKKGK